MVKTDGYSFNGGSVAGQAVYVLITDNITGGGRTRSSRRSAKRTARRSQSAQPDARQSAQPDVPQSAQPDARQSAQPDVRQKRVNRRVSLSVPG